MTAAPKKGFSSSRAVVSSVAAPSGPVINIMLLSSGIAMSEICCESGCGYAGDFFFRPENRSKPAEQ